MRTKWFCWLIILLSGIKLSAQTRPDSSQTGEGLDYLYGTIVGGMNVYLSGSYHLWDFKQNTSNASISYSQDDFLASTLNVSNSNRDTYLFSLKMRPLPQLVFSFRGNFFENYPARSYSSFDSTFYSVTEDKRKKENKNRYFLNGDLAFLTHRGKFSFSEQNGKWYYFINGSNFLLSPNQLKLTTQVRFANEEIFNSEFEKTSIAYTDSNSISKFYSYSQHSRDKSIDFVQTINWNLNDRVYINLSGTYEKDLKNNAFIAHSKMYSTFFPEFQEAFLDTSLKPQNCRKIMESGFGFFLSEKIYNHLNVYYSSYHYESPSIHFHKTDELSSIIFNKTIETITSSGDIDYVQIGYDFYFLNAKDAINKSKALSQQFYGSTLPVGGFIINSSIVSGIQKDNRRPRFNHPGNPVSVDWNNGFTYQILKELSISTTIDMDYFNRGQHNAWIKALNTYQSTTFHELFFNTNVSFKFKNFDYEENYYTWEKRKNEEFRYLGPFLKPGWWVCQVQIDFPWSRWNWYTSEKNPFSHKVDFRSGEYLSENESKISLSNSVGIFKKLSISSAWSWDHLNGRHDQHYFSVSTNYHPLPRIISSLSGSGNYSNAHNRWYNPNMSINIRYFF